MTRRRPMTTALCAAFAVALTVLCSGVANAGTVHHGVDRPASARDLHARAAQARAAQARTVTDPTAPQTASHVCEPYYLCVHLRHSDGTYTWKDMYACGKYTFDDYGLVATWYYNNQRPVGTVARFHYEILGSNTYKDWYYSSISKGRPPDYYDFKKLLVWVRNC